MEKETKSSTSFIIEKEHPVLDERLLNKEAFVKEMCEALEIDKTLLEKKKVVRMEVGS